MSGDDEDDQSKAEGVEDDDSSSAQGPGSDVQPSSSAIQENQIPGSARSEEASQQDGREDPSSVHGTEDSKLIGDAQTMEIDANEDGEYLIRPFLDPGEKLRFRYNCERVLGLDKRDGIFLIGEQCLYVIDNYYIDEEGCIREKGDEGDISVIDRELGVPMTGSNDSQDGMKQSSGSTSETVPVVWQGGREWAFGGGAWGKEKVSAVCLFVVFPSCDAALMLWLLCLVIKSGTTWLLIVCLCLISQFVFAHAQLTFVCKKVVKN